MTFIATGHWEVAGDADWFTADLKKGQSYTIELIGADGSVTEVDGDELFGVSTTTAGGARQPGHFTAGSDGPFTFSALGIDAGSYTIRISEIADDYADNADSTGAIRAGAAHGRFEAVGDSDWFSVPLTAGQAYQSAVSTTNAWDIRIVNTNGQVVELPPVGADGKGVFVADQTGTYEIVVVSTGDAGTFRPVDYDVSFKPIAHVDDYGHTAATAGAITLGGGALPSGSQTGKWELKGDQDWFKVQLQANHSYSISATGAALGAANAGDVTVVDANGNPVWLPGDLGKGGPNATSFTPATSGAYYVQLHSGGATGAYTVTVAVVADDFTNSAVRPGAIAVNGSATGAFEANNDADWFKVDLVAGQSYSTQALMSSGQSSYFGFATFLDASGAPQAQTFTATSTGSYYVQVLGFADGAPKGPNYTLTVKSYKDDYADNVHTTGTITVGGSATGKTEVMFDEDWFKVTLVEGKSYLFTAAGGFVPPSLQIVDANGVFVGSGAITAHASGTYYVSATGILTGNYTLTAAEYPDDYGDTVPTAGHFLDAPDFDFTGVHKTGGDGVDRLVGGTRGDLIEGGAGNDVLSGKGGNDLLDGGAGADRMTGGAGDDAFVVDAKGDKVIEAAGGGHDTVLSTITYTLGAEVEALRLTGDAAVNGHGNAGANELWGNAAANQLFGEAGADVIAGGGGRDQLTGGSGADVFAFRGGDTGATGATADRILDFSHAEGDRIDLSAIDAKAGTGADDAFTFIGSGAFGGHAGELRIAVIAGATYALGDTDGDKVADLMIRVDADQPLAAADFVL